ncbi:MAG: hypothetical protein MK213_06040, partial [Planctomycetes bacterium]|nr:hypothetical protein [Planctomycetota bacterium]
MVMGPHVSMTSSAVRAPLGLVLTCLVCASCSEQKQQHDPSQDAVSFHAVVDSMIHKEGGLLEITERQAREVHELLEVGLEEGRFGQRAKRALEELPHDVAISGLLNSVAKLDAPDTLRFSAYQALLFHTKTPQPAIVPRLVLRLKYEKHLESNLLITELLLRHGNGAGLDV